MRLRLVLAAACVSFFGCVCACEAAGAEPEGKYWALVVGVSDYLDPQIPDLRFPHKDAQAFYRYLCSPQGLGMGPEQIVILLDEMATVANVRSALGDFIAKNAKEEDTVIFFFAGHGGNEVDFLTGGSPETAKYLLAHDTSPDKFYGTAINMKDDLGYVFANRIRAKQILCFLDCCHAGAAQGAATRSVRGRGIAKIDAMEITLPPPEEAFSVADTGKRMLIASACRPDEYALEVDSLGHGVFTHASIEALKGAADANADGSVSVEEYMAHVDALAVELTNGQQHPQFSSNFDGAYVLSRVLSGTGTFSEVEGFLSSSQWTPAVSSQPAAAPLNQVVVESEYLTQIREEKGRILVAVVGNPGKVSNMREALADARRQQRRQLRKHFGFGPDEAERIYRQGEIVDAEELADRTWYLVMSYPGRGGPSGK